MKIMKTDVALVPWVLLLLHVPEPCDLASSVAGPFRIIPDHVEKCPPELLPKLPLVFHYRGVRDRHNPDLWYYTGNFTTLYTFDDLHSVDVNVASWSSRGGWKDNAYLVKIPRLCSTFRASMPSLWRQFMVAIHDNPDAFCPFPPGTYVVRNVTTDLDVKTIPAYFYGKWRITFRMLRSADSETMACLRVFVETVPKMGKHAAAARPHVESRSLGRAARRVAAQSNIGGSGQSIL